MEVSEVMGQSSCCHGVLRQTHQTTKRFKATIKPAPFQKRGGEGEGGEGENPLGSDKAQTRVGYYKSFE